MKYFFDVPVYRLPKADYYSALDAERDSAFDDPIWNEVSSEIVGWSRNQRGQHLHDTYGPWVFNEIVGYIRLYFLGTQVRGEYFTSEKQRTRRTRKKVFAVRDYKLAAEVNFRHDADSIEIYESILKYVDRCRREIPSSRFIDTSHLSTIGPHTDWRTVWEK